MYILLDLDGMVCLNISNSISLTFKAVVFSIVSCFLVDCFLISCLSIVVSELSKVPLYYCIDVNCSLKALCVILIHILMLIYRVHIYYLLHLDDFSPFDKRLSIFFYHYPFGLEVCFIQV